MKTLVSFSIPMVTKIIFHINRIQFGKRKSVLQLMVDSMARVLIGSLETALKRQTILNQGRIISIQNLMMTREMNNIKFGKMLIMYLPVWTTQTDESPDTLFHPIILIMNRYFDNPSPFTPIEFPFRHWLQEFQNPLSISITITIRNPPEVAHDHVFMIGHYMLTWHMFQKPVQKNLETTAIWFVQKHM